MTEPQPSRFESSALHHAMSRRLHTRSMAEGKVVIPAVPGMLDTYVEMCKNLCAGTGVLYTPEQLAQLKAVLARELAKAFKASPRSYITITFDAPANLNGFNFCVKAEWRQIEGDYDRWLDLREGPLFGTEPDARVWALAAEAADPATCRVLDVGAGTGRNALPLARRGHPVDAIEITPKFADIIRTEAQREALDVRVIQSDVFTAMEDEHEEYQLVVLAEVVPDFRTKHELRGLFELAAGCLAPGGRLVFDTFLARSGFTPDDAARELGQQCHTMMFTRDELSEAAAGQPLELVADDSACEYEKAHLPEGAWPPTEWFEGWAGGLDVFDVPPENSPIELRWLVYQRT